MGTDGELSFDEAQTRLAELESNIQTAERDHARHEAERDAGERDLARVVERCEELGVEPDQLDAAIRRQMKKVETTIKAAEAALAGVDEDGDEDDEEGEDEDDEVDALLDGGGDE